MSKFYTNIFKFGSEVHVRGYDKGQRVKFTVPYSPYLFLPKKGGEYHTLDGQECVKKSFNSTT